MATQRVFLDANVIIECFRIGVWSELAQGCWLETVEECAKEALTGDTSRPGRVQVNSQELAAGCRTVHSVSRAERNQLMSSHQGMTSLDPGERDLFAYLYANERPLGPLVVVSTADKGAIVRANDLGWLDQLVSLEVLLEGAGVSRAKMANLGQQYGSAFLAGVRTKVMLGVIP